MSTNRPIQWIPVTGIGTMEIRLPVQRQKYTLEDDINVIKGVLKYGSQWQLIYDDPELGFRARERRNKLAIRDRCRNRFPKFYQVFFSRVISDQQKKAYLKEVGETLTAANWDLEAHPHTCYASSKLVPKKPEATSSTDMVIDQVNGASSSNVPQQANNHNAIAKPPNAMAPFNMNLQPQPIIPAPAPLIPTPTPAMMIPPIPIYFPPPVIPPSVVPVPPPMPPPTWFMTSGIGKGLNTQGTNTLLQSDKSLTSSSSTQSSIAAIAQPIRPGTKGVPVARQTSSASTTQVTQPQPPSQAQRTQPVHQQQKSKSKSTKQTQLRKGITPKALPRQPVVPPTQQQQQATVGDSTISKTSNTTPHPSLISHTPTEPAQQDANQPKPKKRSPSKPKQPKPPTKSKPKPKKKGFTSSRTEPVQLRNRVWKSKGNEYFESFVRLEDVVMDES